MTKVIAALSDSVHIRDQQVRALIEAGAMVRFCKHYNRSGKTYQIEESIEISEFEWNEVEPSFQDQEAILRIRGVAAEICYLEYPYKVMDVGQYQQVEWKEALDNETGYVYYPDTKEYFMCINKNSIVYH